MYDRYKSKKKSTGIYKFFGAIALIAAVAYLGVRYHDYLAFWKYNQSKLEKRIESLRHIKDTEKRREAIIDLSETYDRLKQERQVDPDPFYISGELHFLLGESYLSGSFSELYINDRVSDISKEAKAEFMKAIRDIKKGSALDNGALNDPRSFMLARAALYADYSSPAEIFQIIEKTGESIKKQDAENIRFYSMVNIVNKREDYGLKFLAEYGMVHESIQGLLFFATAERLAKKYTGAIVSYRNVLARTSDERVRKLVHVNLGKIYFNQSLYRESLDQFAQALKIDEKDAMPKIWIGKNYSAMGEKDKAKAIWGEVLTTDGSNTEAKELMKMM
jgi:predicted negative regulator of RcsB-dependent stress response